MQQTWLVLWQLQDAQSLGGRAGGGYREREHREKIAYIRGTYSKMLHFSVESLQEKKQPLEIAGNYCSWNAFCILKHL